MGYTRLAFKYFAIYLRTVVFFGAVLLMVGKKRLAYEREQPSFKQLNLSEIL